MYIEHTGNMNVLDFFQVWSEYNSTDIGQLAKQGFPIIFSNYDKLYLDCGFQSWVGDGMNWCSPYKTWQGIHDNDPRTLISDMVGTKMTKAQIEKIALGAEVALWSEQADPTNMDSRIWPRAAAHAERYFPISAKPSSCSFAVWPNWSPTGAK